MGNLVFRVNESVPSSAFSSGMKSDSAVPLTMREKHANVRQVRGRGVSSEAGGIPSHIIAVAC